MVFPCDTIDGPQSTYRISANSFRGNYSFLDLWMRLLFKGGNYSKEETINFLLFVWTIWIIMKYISTHFISPITLWLILNGLKHSILNALKHSSILKALKHSILYVLFIWLKCDYYSREETIQGRKLLIFRRFLLRKLFKGGKYSREETIRGNTVVALMCETFVAFWEYFRTSKISPPLLVSKTLILLR